MIEAMRVETGDGAVTGARIAGASGPALIFVHGVGSTAAIWDAQLAAFSDDFRCAAIELRGASLNLFAEKFAILKQPSVLLFLRIE